MDLSLKRIMAMGLDMFLEARTNSDLLIEGYWRKSNQIHNWFVINAQDDVDECQQSPVKIEQLVELRKLCRRAIRTKDASLLPPVEGFFFGSTDIDKWYWSDLADTVEILTRFIDEPDLNNTTITYHSSW